MNRNFETALAAYCAPTLAALKPASLFRWSGDPHGPNAWGLKFKSFGLGLRSLKRCPDGGCLLYLYRARWLRRILSDPDNAAFLRSRGYVPERDVESMLDCLSEKFHAPGAFPHEIGVFLGYPLEDVRGFIENGGQNYTCCGCWKAYGDPEAARKKFASYRRCTEIYRRNVRMGVALESLICASFGGTSAV
ncbi:MAG: DUF3793 family protein [Oscillibacter sp.]|nr:DUF3793 family protein [Oscillibacter sp.]